MTVLTTSRLTIRPKSPDDLQAYLVLVSDFELVKWTMSWPFPPDEAYTLDRLNWPRPKLGMDAVILLDGTLIGSVALAGGEVGYMLARSHQGRGLATEAVTAMLDWGFSLGHRAITAGVFDGNTASIRLLTRLGFSETGRGTAFCRARGVELAGPDFILTRDDWAARSIEFPVRPA
jgi:RimJ/RimL family protein N-acetyltransferase